MPSGAFVSNTSVPIRRVDEGRYAVAVDGIVRYVGTQEECERRVAIMVSSAASPAGSRASSSFLVGILLAGCGRARAPSADRWRGSLRFTATSQGNIRSKS